MTSSAPLRWRRLRTGPDGCPSGWSVDALRPLLGGPGAVVPLPHVQRHDQTASVVEQVDDHLVVVGVLVDYAEGTGSWVDASEQSNLQSTPGRCARHRLVVAGAVAVVPGTAHPGRVSTPPTASARQRPLRT